MTTQQKKRKKELKLFLITLYCFIFLSLICFSNLKGADLKTQSVIDINTLINNPKLNHPEAILKNFTDGKPTIRIIVNLLPSIKGPDPGFHNKSVRQQINQEVKRFQNQVIDDLDSNHIRITNRFTYIFGFSAEVTPTGLQALVGHPDVLSIDEDGILHPQTKQGIPLINASTARNTYNGAGLSIAICDSGIDYTHPMLGNGGFPNSKVIGGYDTGENDNDPMDGHGHGTCCAGIAAGNLGTTGDYIGGVAHKAKLYALKTTYTDTNNSSWVSDMVEAWEWCVSHQDDDPNNPIMIISTSCGFDDYKDESSCDLYSSAMTTAAANAKEVGIIIFAGTGNEGFCKSICWPGCISHVVSVGAVYDSDIGVYPPHGDYNCLHSESCKGYIDTDFECPESGICYRDHQTTADLVPGYSNVASIMTLFAPAELAYTTDITGSGGFNKSGDYYDKFHGTSAATPYAAGAAACLQQAAKSKIGEYLNPDDVEDYLVENGDLVTDEKAGITKPRVNLGNAIAKIDCPTPSITISSPNGGERWGLDSSMNIAWNSMGVSGDLEITLLKDEVVLGIIANIIDPNSGSFSWQVGQHSGGMALAGSGYKIKIQEQGTSVSDTSDSPFTLIEIPPDYYIDLTTPEGGETFNVNDVIPIEWNAGGPEDFTVNIYLVKKKSGGAETLISRHNVPHTRGRWSFTIPDDWILSDSEGCFVSIKKSNDEVNVMDKSGIFTINPLQQPLEFVVGGQTESFTHGSGDSDFLLYKLGEQGDKIWRKNFGGTGNDNGWSVHKTSDGGYVMAGSSDSFTHGGRDFLIYKLDVDGNKQWRKNFGGTQHDDARFIRQTSDGGYIVAGYTRSFSQGQNDFLIYKLNANGNRQWRKNFGGTGDDKARSIYQTMDGGYILIGTSNSFYHGPTVNKDILIYKLDASGHNVWSKNLGGTGDDFGHSVMQTSDGGYIIAGYGNSFTHGGYDALVYKLDPNGTKQWRRNYGGTGNDYCYSIVQASDGGYVVAGSSNSSGTHGGYDMVVYKTNSSGYLEETKFFGGLLDDYGYSISNVGDGGYIISGWTKSWVHGSAGVDTDFLVYRLDSNRNKLWKKYLGGIQDDRAYSVK